MAFNHTVYLLKYLYNNSRTSLLQSPLEYLQTIRGGIWTHKFGIAIVLGARIHRTILY